LTTNRDYLRRVLDHPKFVEGQVDTHFIETYGDALAPIKTADEKIAQAIAVMLTGSASKKNSYSGVAAITAWDNINSFRNV
ncbi:MAG: hypothetical protein ACPGJV_15310, partial [Bacteriovoracaceae bacterium]